MISAILLSWKRSHNLPRIVDELARVPGISEILLWNNNPDIQLRLPKVTVIQSGRNFGCLARYCLVPLAANDTIWFQDDDLLVPAGQFEAIRPAYEADPSRIYGIAGRNIVNGLYSADTVYGECDIVLGQAMLFHRKLQAPAFEPFAALPPEMGEDDIVFSLASPRRPCAIEIRTVDLGQGDDVALWRRPDHFARRQQAVDFMAGRRTPASRGWERPASTEKSRE
jgi:hypothetical protein